MMGLWIILMVLGAAVVWVGRRGFRAGHHPHCAECDFDLYNLPEETKRCPECGAFIRVEEAVRLGRRRPVGLLVAAGILLMVIGGGMGVMAGMHWWPSWNASRFKTVGMLEGDMQSLEDRVRRRGCEELLRRIRAGALNNAQCTELIGRILKLQAEPAGMWRTEWGDLVQAVRETGRLPGANWTTYLEQALQVNVRARPRVRVDDPVPFEVSCSLRGGSDYRQIAPRNMTPWVEVSMLGEKAVLPAQAQALDVVPMPVHWLVHWLPGDPWPASLRKPGMQVAHVEARVELMVRGNERVVVTRSTNVAIEILPAGEASVKLGTVIPGMEAEMESAVKLRVAGGGGEGLVPVPQMPVGTLWIGAPPMAASFRVMLRQGEKSWLLARVLVRTNDALSVPLAFPQGAGALKEGEAEVVCVPELQGAVVGTVEVMEIWPGEVTRQINIGRTSAAGK